ncbi:dihydrolipoyl dehydrogenase family protein [Candidatus Aenigmatarchaeota archaeon]
MKSVTIIGCGPAGYTTAIQLAKRGFGVNVIEKNDLGGVCLNYGCIPSKLYFEILDTFRRTNELLKEKILDNDDLYKLMKEKKNLEISSLRQAIENHMQSCNINIHRGNAKIKSKNLIAVDGKDIESDYIIISTGSVEKEIKGFEIDNKKIITPKTLFMEDCYPESMLIVGGGSVGTELAFIYSSLGKKVYLAESEINILNNMDIEISKYCAEKLSLLGVDIITGVRDFKPDGGEIIINSDTETRVQIEKIVICAGRKCNFPDSIIDIHTERGFIKVDKNYQTNFDNIFCIGDANGISMTASEAQRQAIQVTDFISNGLNVNRQTGVPACAFSFCPLSSVGMREQDIKNGEKITKLLYNFNTRAKISSSEGFVKFITKNDILLGAHIAGKDAEYLIMLVSGFIGKNVRELINFWFFHPSISELLLETALMCIENSEES